LIDIRAVAALAGDAIVAVDNTFATPYLQRPIELGADIVVHSTTIPTALRTQSSRSPQRSSTPTHQPERNVLVT